MTQRVLTRIIAACATAALTVATLAAQAPPRPAAPRPDSPEIQQRLDDIRKAAGPDWAETVDFLCAANANRANRPDDPALTPTRVFDNLAVVGRTGTAIWIVTTSAGLVLIDSGYEDQLDSVLLKGMAALGLDPARVTHVVIAHGHADHVGGARYFQQRGARVVMGDADWTLAPSLMRDVTMGDGQTLRVGDVTFTFAAVPGHTAGSLGVIVPVKDGQAMHRAGLFGGSVLIPGFIGDEGLRQYARSVEHWAAVTRAMNVDVEIQNHPLYDGFVPKLARVSQRRPGQPHPFVVGAAAYQRFVEVMSGCAQVQFARREAAARTP
jgi:metallo-beta-lactamase class B